MSDIEGLCHPSSSVTDTLVVTPMNRSILVDRAFSVAASRAWNGLPTSVRTATSLSTFRQQLKTVIYFRIQFWCQSGQSCHVWRGLVSTGMWWDVWVDCVNKREVCWPVCLWQIFLFSSLYMDWLNVLLWRGGQTELHFLSNQSAFHIITITVIRVRMWLASRPIESSTELSVIYNEVTVYIAVAYSCHPTSSKALWCQQNSLQNEFN